MDSKDAIIAKIIDDAEKKAAAMREEADKKYDTVIADAEKWATEYKRVQREMLKEDTENILSRREVVAELDCRKIALAAKREVIEDVFSSALEKLCNLPDREYLALLDNLLSNYAETGDEIMISANAHISANAVESLASARKLGLKVKGTAPIKGGIILVNAVCDKDLSFETLAEVQKASLEGEIAVDLFGNS